MESVQVYSICGHKWFTCTCCSGLHVHTCSGLHVCMLACWFNFFFQASGLCHMMGLYEGSTIDIGGHFDMIGGKGKAGKEIAHDFVVP